MHYSIFNEKNGMSLLRELFPSGECNDLNFVLLSTSGVHGTYTAIEEIEESLKKYGEDPDFLSDCSDDSVPDDYCPPDLTFLIVHPRTVTLRYGNARVSTEDIEFLKRIRKSSWDVVRTIGASS
jgi:hypothetical protein